MTLDVFHLKGILTGTFICLYVCVSVCVYVNVCVCVQIVLAIVVNSTKSLYKIQFKTPAK